MWHDYALVGLAAEGPGKTGFFQSGNPE